MSKIFAFALKLAICLPVFAALIWYSDQMGYRRGFAKGLAEAAPAIVQSSTGRGSSNVVGGGNVTITCGPDDREDKPK